MRNFINLIFLVLAFNHIVGENRPRLTSVSYSPHVLELYHILRTEDAPSEFDPANSSDPESREDICWDASHSGLFRWMQFRPLSNQEIRRGWKKAKSEHFFNLMYDASFNYTNPYRLVTFDDKFREWKEYVLICAIKDGAIKRKFLNRMFPYEWSHKTTPFYITKEYNVGLPGQPYKPGRFIVGSVEQPKSNHIHGRVEVFEDILLVEEAAKIYTHPDFNAELYYLQIRKYIDPVEKNKNPLCNLVSESPVHPANQHQRLCTAAMSKLSYFQDERLYVSYQSIKSCKEEEIIFKMEDCDESYIELLTSCILEGGPLPITMFMSRGYKSNDVFIYRLHNDKIYLEALGSGVSLIDELNSFDFIED